MNAPLISIITCSYNVDRYIGQCIESVISQSLDDFEYIVIDGGSIDKTVEIINYYQHKLTYWHSKPDRGIGHAFNLGMAQSRGQWIMFLNADDYLASPSILVDIAEFIQANIDADVIYGQMVRVSRTMVPKAIEVPYGGEFSWGEFKKRDTIPYPAAFTNRVYFERIGNFDESYKLAMDYELFMRAGDQLDARYYDGVVTCMREGGLSRVMEHQVYDEWRKAHRKHGHASNWFVNSYYYYYHYFRILLKGLCGPRCDG